MKTKIAAICVAAAIVVSFISCNWFGKSKSAAFNIEGNWVIDSMENLGSDTGFASLGLLVLAINQDSLPLGIVFNADSSYRLVNSSDSLAGQYSFSDDGENLLVTEHGDSTRHTFRFITKSDSAFSVLAKDSLVYHLRRR